MKSSKVTFEKMAEDGSSSKETEYEETLFSKRVKFVLNRFAERTSMHGCGYIQTSRHRFKKILWGFLTSVAIAVLIIHLYMITSQYIKWPKQTTLSLEFNNLRFPAVTICNVNVFKKSALPFYANNELRAMVEAVNPRFLTEDHSGGWNALNSSTWNGEKERSASDGNVLNREGESRRKKRSVSELYDIEWTKFDEDSTIQQMGMTNEDEEVNDEWIAGRASLSLVWDIFRYLFMKLPKHDRAASGHNITDMLLECIFNGRACHASNFTLHQTPSYGNCYTIDSNRMYVKRPGPDGGFTLFLYLQTNEFLEGITSGFGAKVIIHEPGSAPLPDDDGVFVASASETDIALKRTVINRLGQPWGECETGEKLRQKLGLTYTVKLCHLACQAIYIWETCKCWHYMYELIAERMNKSFNICSSKSEKKCLLKVLQTYYTKTLHCDCKNPCSDAQYDVSISSRQWPSESYAAILKAGVCRASPEECTQMRSFSNHQQLMRNFLRLNIYYETLNFGSLTESPLIDPFTFLASIGGAVGLWIGLSMLSVCEVLQLMTELIMCMVAKFVNCRTAK